MSKETKKHMFEPFFTTKDIGKGTGMGLAAVYGTVKNHGGYIDVQSEKKRGTIFNIYLPLLETGNRAVSKETQVIPIMGKGLVLVVDDEKIVRETTVLTLENLGYDVLSCSDGSEAVELYRKSWEKIDLIILDLMMPVLTGNDTYDEMRKINPKAKVILASGYSLNKEAQRALDKGATAFIQKPFKITEFSSAVFKGINEKK